jgi:RHH-type rel operon transcriptional repressor/antitoxin RelB
MTLAVRLPADVEERLRSLAERSGRSKASFAREAIVRYLEDLEDEELALERLRNPERCWTLDELERRVDLSAIKRPLAQHDPFACFDEWASDADTNGYASL